MDKKLSQLFCDMPILGILALLISFSQNSFAQPSSLNQPDAAKTNFLISTDKATKLQLEVRQMPMVKVLESIAHKTNIPIHYSVLPAGLVTATCVGSGLKPILECLLNRKADLIVRYLSGSSGDDSQQEIAEAWILGARIDGVITPVDCSATAGKDKGLLTFQQNENNVNAEPDQTAVLLKAAQAKDPIARAEAIGNLLAGGRKGDPAVRAALEQALTDKDDNVRAQAISSLAHREGNGAIAAIQEAMHDKSVDVRTMAVDGIIDDVALLQQAINDSDETIRSLAAVKLEALTQANKSMP